LIDFAGRGNVSPPPVQPFCPCPIFFFLAPPPWFAAPSRKCVSLRKADVFCRLSLLQVHLFPNRLVEGLWKRNALFLSLCVFFFPLVVWISQRFSTAAPVPPALRGRFLYPFFFLPCSPPPFPTLSRSGLHHFLNEMISMLSTRGRFYPTPEVVLTVSPPSTVCAFSWRLFSGWSPSFPPLDFDFFILFPDCFTQVGGCSFFKFCPGIYFLDHRLRPASCGLGSDLLVSRIPLFRYPQSARLTLP